MVFGGHSRVGGGYEAAITYAQGFKHVAEFVHLQGQLMPYARIGCVSLVMRPDGLARMREEDRMPVAAPRLQAADREILFGYAIRSPFLAGTVERIDLLP